MNFENLILDGYLNYAAPNIQLRILPNSFYWWNRSDSNSYNYTVDFSNGMIRVTGFGNCPDIVDVIRYVHSNYLVG